MEHRQLQVNVTVVTNTVSKRLATHVAVSILLAGSLRREGGGEGGRREGGRKRGREGGREKEREGGREGGERDRQRAGILKIILTPSHHSMVEHTIWDRLPGVVLDIEGLADHMDVCLLPHLFCREHPKLQVSTAIHQHTHI